QSSGPGSPQRPGRCDASGSTRSPQPAPRLAHHAEGGRPEPPLAHPSARPEKGAEFQGLQEIHHRKADATPKRRAWPARSTGQPFQPAETFHGKVTNTIKLHL